MGDPVTEFINRLRQQGGGSGGTSTPARPMGGGALQPDESLPPFQPTDVAANPTTPSGRQLGRVSTTEDINRNIATDISRSGSSSTTGGSTTTRVGETTATGTERRYIDIPTPEEFLDDFRNGFSTYLKGLRQAGSIGVNMATWLMDNMDMFWGEYLGSLGQMAQRGEPVFRATQVSADITPLGQRPGDVSSVRTQGATTTREQADRTTAGATTTRESTSQQTGVGQTATQEGAPGAQISAEQQVLNQIEAQRLNETQRTQSDLTEQFNQDTRQNVNMTEDVFARPKIGVVHTLSPLDFLGQQFPASSLSIMFEGRRAMRAANARVGQGTVSPRRVQ